MTTIVKATRNDYRLLSEIAKLTFIESHGHSAKSEDINFYISQKYQESIFEEELLNNENIYHIIYHNNVVAGFSNIILNSPYPGSKNHNIAKLERLYLLREFYSLKLGRRLFEFNINIARQNNQTGIWLYVWKENQRAINFYQKVGFTIIGSHDFKISDTHSNPNHLMFLRIQ